MSVTPGPTITRSTVKTASVGDTDTGKWFLVGYADHGPLNKPVEINNMGDYATTFGLRTSVDGADNSILYDALDLFFRDGGTRAVVQRHDGASAVVASNTILDGSSATVGTVRAASAGTWGNNLTFTVQTNSEDSSIPSGSFVVIVYLSTVEVERSPVLLDKAALLAWAPAVVGSGTAQYIGITSGASALDPAAVVARALSSGANDRATAPDTQRTAALALFTDDLGPGQVSVPGATTAATHALAQAHADAHNRVALLDAVDTATVATITGVAATDRAATGKQMSAIFGPWITVPGLTTNTTRTVAPSALAAALMARSDNAGNTPNVPAAGENGVSGYATGLSQVAWSVADRGTLNEAGVAVFRQMFGAVRLYGYRTLTDPTTDPTWIGLNNSRMYTLLAARLNLVAEQFDFDETSPGKVGEFAGALTGVLLDYYPGSLFGDTFSDAALVDTSINTPAYLASLRMGATVEVRLSRFAERVPITIVSVAPTEVL